ncbi:MAG: AraC family transcriptional regulator [Bacteroidota bacterium]
MIEHYSATDIVLLLGIGQGLFLSFSLLLIQKKNRAANRILALQLVLSCLILLARMMLHKADEFWVIQRLAPLESLIFVVGPLGYVYFKRLFEKGQSKYMVNSLHFAPALVYLTFLSYLNSYSNEEFGQKLISGGFHYFFLVAELTAIIFNLYYWFLSFRFIQTIQKKVKEQFSFAQSTLTFAKILLIASITILTIWAIGFFNIQIFRLQIPTITYNVIWIGIPVLIYIVGFYAIRQPEIFRVLVEEKAKTKLRKLLDDKSIADLKRKLEQLMESEKAYLDNELTLVNLSKELNTSTNNLSWLLNTIYQTNFYDFVNEYRIKEFILKLEHNEHKVKTLLSLSMEVGFNSKSTFNKAFKSVQNETPSSYIKRLAS